MDLLVVVANLVCWGTVVVIWIVLGIRDARTAWTAPIRASTDAWMSVVAVVAVAAMVLVGPALLAPFTVDAAWVRLIGAVILIGSTIFAVWARLTLGGSWSVGPQASTERGLHTDGPYAITRHPIYTGLLGMMLGSALLGGLGQWIVLVVAGLVVFGLKIRSEERLLLATFPDAYAAYRERVPRLIPRWRSRPAVRRRPS